VKIALDSSAEIFRENDHIQQGNGEAGTNQKKRKRIEIWSGMWVEKMAELNGLLAD
jgi:hypothetical protein